MKRKAVKTPYKMFKVLWQNDRGHLLSIGVAGAKQVKWRLGVWKNSGVKNPVSCRRGLHLTFDPRFHTSEQMRRGLQKNNEGSLWRTYDLKLCRVFVAMGAGKKTDTILGRGIEKLGHYSKVAFEYAKITRLASNKELEPFGLKRNRKGELSRL